jgi:hypothetical protein
MYEELKSVFMPMFAAVEDDGFGNKELAVRVIGKC